jgi:hypothetical protein
MNEPRVVNLDDLANSVEVIMADKPFKISRITMQIRTIYGQYLQFCGEYLVKIAKIQEAPDTLEASEYEKLAEETQKTVTDFAIGKAEFINKMMGLILKHNGYEFDFAWWEANSDYSHMEQFIVQALKKDEPDNPKTSKKKVMVS